MDCYHHWVQNPSDPVILDRPPIGGQSRAAGVLGPGCGGSGQIILVLKSTFLLSVRIFAAIVFSVFIQLDWRSTTAAAQSVAAPEMIEATGATMGTQYLVKLFAPPSDLPEDWKLTVDAELRRVNDQMSTYLRSSELSRFNDSESTEWFAVSAETAMVVAKGLQIAELSEGALDITVGPLVNLWSFGPEKRRLEPPSDQELTAALDRIGYRHLTARLDPPALKKDLAELQVDLSAIAKGHGVDRVIDVLRRMKVANAFVEIGGEVRVMGDKAGKPWTVGIQQPDVAGAVVAIAWPMNAEAIATSGDYRNYFEHDGRRYSHTIDPRTGRPVEHRVASVSVLAEDCMTADAWATALNVLGPLRGKELADQLGLDTLMMLRGDSGWASLATGGFTEAASQWEMRSGAAETEKGTEKGMSIPGWLTLAVICVVAFGFVITLMAIGVMFGRRSISGSCGGLANRRDADGNIRCGLCSNPENACKELRDKMQGEPSQST